MDRHHHQWSTQNGRTHQSPVTTSDTNTQFNDFQQKQVQQQHMHQPLSVPITPIVNQHDSTIFDSNMDSSRSFIFDSSKSQSLPSHTIPSNDPTPIHAQSKSAVTTTQETAYQPATTPAKPTRQTQTQSLTNTIPSSTDCHSSKIESSASSNYIPSIYRKKQVSNYRTVYGGFHLCKKQSIKVTECKNYVVIGKLINSPDQYAALINRIVVVKSCTAAINSNSMNEFHREIRNELKMKNLIKNKQPNKDYLFITSGSADTGTTDGGTKYKLSFMIFLHKGMTLNCYVSDLRIKYQLPIKESTIRLIFIVIITFLILMRDAGYLHRDLNPNNILINAHDTKYKINADADEYTVDELWNDESKMDPTIIDFGESMGGIQRRTNSTSSMALLTSDRAAHPIYGAPESFSLIGNPKRNGFRTDVWSIGMTGLHIIKGEEPWTVDDCQDKFVNWHYFFERICR